MDRSVRAGGRVSAFALWAAFAAWPAAAPAQIFGDTTERVSVASDGTQANTGSTLPSISGDGRFVAFMSEATNLASGATEHRQDIYVRDRQTGLTELISGGGSREENDNPALSDDGRFVAFDSYASNLVAGDIDGTYDTFVRDRLIGTTEQVSVASDGSQGNDHSGGSAISADGRFVAFGSSASNLVAGDTNGVNDIFVHDRQTGITERVSIASDGTEGNDQSLSAAISADGRFVAFSSEASNLVPGDTNFNGTPDTTGTTDVFVHDRQTGITERVSVASDGAESNGFSGYYNTAISADGRFVAFVSGASNLVAGDTNDVEDVFVHDRQSRLTERVSVANSGSQANDESQRASISGDGRFVAFASRATNLIAGGTTSGRRQIFIRDRLMQTTELVSVSSDGMEEDYGSYYPDISADGRVVAFQSYSSNLVAGDTNGSNDIFVRIANRQAAPVSPRAHAGGPYALCANFGPLILDATGSINFDEGQSDPGAPGDRIQAYEWDLDGDGAFDDASGAEPDGTAIFAAAPAGIYPIALRVTDTTATSFPSSGLPDQSDVDAAEVTVLDPLSGSCACVSNLTWRVKSGKVQLTWTDVGALGGYRVYRATPAGTASYPAGTLPAGRTVYIDGNVDNGTTYEYQVVTLAGNGAETCPSKAVMATPHGR